MGVGSQGHAPVNLPTWKIPSTHCTGDWVGPTAGLDGWRKSRPHRDYIPGPSSPKIVAILSTLSQPNTGLSHVTRNLNQKFPNSAGRARVLVTRQRNGHKDKVLHGSPSLRRSCFIGLSCKENAVYRKIRASSAYPNRGSVQSDLRSNDEGTVLSKICWVQLPDLRRSKFVLPKK